MEVASMPDPEIHGDYPWPYFRMFMYKNLPKSFWLLSADWYTAKARPELIYLQTMVCGLQLADQ
jgi:hypothetical protein